MIFIQLSRRFPWDLMEKNSFVSVSIKKQPCKKLQKLSKKEKHTLSDQLVIILDFYRNTREVNSWCLNHQLSLDVLIILKFQRKRDFGIKPHVKFWFVSHVELTLILHILKRKKFEFLTFSNISTFY